LHINHDVVALPGPTDIYSPIGFERGINGVTNQIDQQLFQLHAIGLNHDLWAGNNVDRQTSFQSCHSANQIPNVKQLKTRLRQTR